MTWNAKRVAHRKGTKYKSVKVAGYASKKEARRAQDLALLVKMGAISDLRQQVRYELIPKQDGERAVTYTADFVYCDDTGKTHVEDVKGFRTQQYIIRRKLMKWVHQIKVEEL